MQCNYCFSGSLDHIWLDHGWKTPIIITAGTRKTSRENQPNEGSRVEVYIRGGCYMAFGANEGWGVRSEWRDSGK